MLTIACSSVMGVVLTRWSFLSVPLGPAWVGLFRFLVSP